MTLHEALHQLKSSLIKIYQEDEALNIAELVLQHVTGFTRSRMIVEKKKEISSEQKAALDRFSSELLTRKPVQYVLGEAWFMEMKFIVNESVLIPRPETEELVDLIVKDLTTRMRENKNQISILDVGTGSGCIAVALKKLVPTATVSSVDVSDDALKVAEQNAALHGAEVKFQRIDILDEQQWAQLPSFDVIVSNPPYIPVSEKSGMNDNVVNFEPHTALFVSNEDPLIFYREILKFAVQRCEKQASLYFEIHENMGGELDKAFSEYNPVILKDLQGKDRICVIRLS